MNLQIYEEAADWIVRHRNGELDANEKRRFDAWLRAAPQHVLAYLEMSSLWEDLPSLDASWNASADELIARARTDHNVVELLGGPASSSKDQDAGPTAAALLPSVRWKRFATTLAASVLLAWVGAWIYSQRNVYETVIGEQRSLALPDGSTVELNSQSRIKVRYSDRERRVELAEGQALFRVAKNANRPFVVQTGKTAVRAVGTAFDVYRTERGPIVTVVEGRVAVQSTQLHRAAEPRARPSESMTDDPRSSRTTGAGSASPIAGNVISSRVAPTRIGEAEIFLDAGQQLAITATETPTPRLADIAAATAWTRRHLIFDSVPLTEVAREFNRYNTRRLVIEVPELEGFLVSGVFSSSDPDLLLRFLRAQPGLSVHETDTEIRIDQQ